MEGRKSMLGSQRSGIALVQNMLGERLSSKLSGFGSGNVYMDMPAYDNPLSDDDYDPELGSEVTSETKAPKRKGLRITFQHINYSVPDAAIRGQIVTLLTDVTGFIAPARMTALLGPSGSGKTTLIDVLAGRKTIGTLSGNVLFAGKPASRTYLRRYTGYVEQFDTLLENLTVFEMLIYTAELKMPQEHSYEFKAERVEELIQQLALSSCRNVRIGSSMAKGISGGQSKRVNIGIALVTHPRVLFLDEPTTGLDSFTSQEIMKVVKGLAKKDAITVAATIHSPSPFTFRLFDKVIILLQGRIAYFGNNGQQAIDYFEGYFPDVHPFGEEDAGNQAEWLVNITTKADRDGSAVRYADMYASSQLRQDNDNKPYLVAEREGRTRASVTTLTEMAVSSEAVNTFWWGYYILLKYRMVSNYQDPKFVITRAADKVIVTILMMLLYWEKGDDNRNTNLMNISALLYMWAMLPAFSAAAYVPSLVLERPLFVRERSDGLYLAITYLCAKLTEEIFLAVIFSLVFSCLVFFPLELLGQWVFFWLIYLTTCCIGINLAYAVAAASDNLDAANALLPAYIVTLLFFTGCLLRIPDIPDYAQWYTYLNFIRFSWGAVMINQYEHTRPEFLPGINILQFYSFDKVSKWAYWGFELCFLAGFFILAWLALAFKKHQKR